MSAPPEKMGSEEVTTIAFTLASFTILM